MDVSFVIVTYNSAGALERTLPPLVAQLGARDELVIFDNASSDATLEVVARLAPAAKLVSSASNVGFSEGCNEGAREASGELLVFLNPDAAPAAGFCDAIRRPARDDFFWSAWMGLVTTDAGARVNTKGNIVHFTGITWAGGSGDPVPEGLEAAEVPAASGACLAVDAKAWQRSGGFPRETFMYHEDVDLSLRLHLAGEGVGIEPAARVDHSYEFGKGSYKWRLLERNRWATVLRTYPSPLLVLLAPALLATELALIFVSIGGGWAGQKLLANLDVLGALPRLLRERRAVQATRKVGAGEFARWLTADLDSPYIRGPVSSAPVRFALRAYWRTVVVLLGSPSARP